ncbi:unnamed protein product, partial [Scytosiphon promiscuus]
YIHTWEKKWKKKTKKKELKKEKNLFSHYPYHPCRGQRSPSPPPCHTHNRSVLVPSSTSAPGCAPASTRARTEGEIREEARPKTRQSSTMGVVHKVVRKAASFESQMAAANRRTPSPPAVPSPPPAATTPVSSTAPAVSKYPRFGKRGAPQAFPSKLYEILEGENPEIVGWTATGRGFEVRDHARLSSEVLGRFFKQDKFSSFQRQLNLYGFRKITKGSESGSYQHPHFRRGERTTLLTIRRSTKASPARVVVPVSPASAGAGTPPASVPLASSNSGGGGKGSKTELKVESSKNVSAISEQARSATPSPPPAPVARGVLPWPRPPALLTGAAMQEQQQHASGAREVSPDAASMNNAGKMGPADRQQPWPSAGDGGNSWGARGHPAAPASGAASSTTDNNNDNNSNNNNTRRRDGEPAAADGEGGAGQPLAKTGRAGGAAVGGRTIPERVFLFFLLAATAPAAPVPDAPIRRGRVRRGRASAANGFRRAPVRHPQPRACRRRCRAAAAATAAAGLLLRLRRENAALDVGLVVGLV